MRTAIIGAGIAGLAAARALHKAGWEAVVFEKSSALGGRCATRSMGPYVVDPGTTSIAPRGKSLAPVIFNELSAEELVPIKLPIYVHAFGRIHPGDASKNHIERYTYRSGNAMLPKMLSEGLDVRLEKPLEAIEKSSSGGYRIENEDFDALILTPPLPQSEQLLFMLNETRPFANARYRPCLSVLLGFSQELEGLPYHAVLDPEQRHPLTWLSIESAKCPDRAPAGHTAMVAQMSPDYSKTHFESEDAAVIEEALSHIERLYGPRFAEPGESQVKRWRYSQPETTALFDTVNRPGSKLLIASDGIVGGRVEYAYDAGVRAAKMLMETT